MGEEMKGQRIGYVRVSTIEQNTTRQLESVTRDRVFTDRHQARIHRGHSLWGQLAFVREGDNQGRLGRFARASPFSLSHRGARLGTASSRQPANSQSQGVIYQ